MNKVIDWEEYKQIIGAHICDNNCCEIKEIDCLPENCPEWEKLKGVKKGESHWKNGAW